MDDLKSAYRGCLLGLAVGDALGNPADKLTMAQIREDFGPNGLMGYDGDVGRVTSHTQLCAFTANGLLLGQTRGQVSGKMAPFVRYMALSQREWAKAQRPYATLERTYCWVYWVDEFRRRACADPRMIEMLSADHIGSLDEPINRLDGCGSLTAAVATGLFGADTARLGAEAVALTYGHSTAILSGAILSELVYRTIHRRSADLRQLVEESLVRVEEVFADQFPKTRTVTAAVRYAMDLAAEGPNAIEQLVCQTAPQVLAGAVYTMIRCGNDFDAAMIAAVNHSGRSAAVASVVGAVLGAKLGHREIPEFYLENLEAAEDLWALADDLCLGCPSVMEMDWDRKYIQGER